MLLFFLSLGLEFNSQTIIKGHVSDKETGEDLIGASIKIIDSKYGCVTDFNGNFKLNTNINLPFSIEISYIGYNQKILPLNDNESLKIELSSTDMQLDAVEVIGGISKKLKESPLSIQSMDINDIKQTSATDFYEGLSHMKGVDLTSASLGFKVINTRGFNSTSPVRSLQIIDGVDNASPGLNFALGNFLGASELDLMKVEIVSGASSAFYGPNAFNGVISMQTKDPFLFPGFSASIKTGSRLLNEYAIRYAEVFKDKNGNDKFAYKFNLFYMNAYDWEATNDNSVEGNDKKIARNEDGRIVAEWYTDNRNPGGYDAVNRYGDENLNIIQNNVIYSPSGNIDEQALWQIPGALQWHRTGYWEKDIVDYNTENLKAALGLHYKISDDIELSTSSNFGTGTTVYQGDNRFSLRDIKFFQNKIELKKENDFFIRFYSTHEDAGNSYDAVLTAFLMQDAAASSARWEELYQNYWKENIDILVRNLDTNINWVPSWGVGVDFEDMNQVFSQNYDSLYLWHQQTAQYANTATPSGFSGEQTLDFFQPGSERFDSLKNSIISKAAFEERGSKIVDKSALYHIHAEKIFDKEYGKITVGANARLYTPKSEGSLFSDTNETKIYNLEGGIYSGFEKKLLKDHLIFKSSIRIDKNQNFDILPSPAISFIYNINQNNTLRTTFTSAIRNPTLLNQYMYYNVGRAILIGNISGYDSLISPENYINYLTNQGDGESQLKHFTVNPIKPEKVKCIELGFRSNINNKVYLDANYYFNWYNDFIGYLVGINGRLNYAIDASSGDTINIAFNNPQAYRIATNSNERITTQGASLGINYYVNNKFEINANYSWNVLNKKSEDPIVPAYNTPENKFNIGLTGRDIKIELINVKDIGFNINYKWVEGFLFEGSPQFTGQVPTYSLLDVQINRNFKKQNLTFKLGASNVLNNSVLQVYGGPYIGRMIYCSFLFDWRK